MMTFTRGKQIRQSPRPRSGDGAVADFTTMVRDPGRPAAVHDYTHAEYEEAARYTVEVGGEAVPLLLSPLVGYETGPDESPISVTSAEREPVTVEDSTARIGR
jgi:hypothetical protein